MNVYIRRLKKRVYILLNNKVAGAAAFKNIFLYLQKHSLICHSLTDLCGITIANHLKAFRHDQKNHLELCRASMFRAHSATDERDLEYQSSISTYIRALGWPWADLASSVLDMRAPESMCAMMKSCTKRLVRVRCGWLNSKGMDSQNTYLVSPHAVRVGTEIELFHNQVM